jgi:hypothetical protein
MKIKAKSRGLQRQALVDLEAYLLTWQGRGQQAAFFDRPTDRMPIGSSSSMVVNLTGSEAAA